MRIRGFRVRQRSMKKAIGSLGLALALLLGGVVGACGPTPEPNTPPTPTGEPTSTAAPTATPTVEPTATPTPTTTATPTATASTPPPAAPPSQPIVASKLAADLKAIGLDLNKLPSLEKMPLATKKKVMPLFQKALGYEGCNGCHAEGDFKKETRNLKIARNMWNSFVVPLREEKGGAIFCDSCHNGKPKILNRSDMTAVGKFMEAEYEDKMSRADKKSHSCGSCHGDPFEPKIQDKLWKVGN